MSLPCHAGIDFKSADLDLPVDTEAELADVRLADSSSLAGALLGALGRLRRDFARRIWDTNRDVRPGIARSRPASRESLTDLRTVRPAIRESRLALQLSRLPNRTVPAGSADPGIDSRAIHPGKWTVRPERREACLLKRTVRLAGRSPRNPGREVRLPERTVRFSGRTIRSSR